MEKLEQRGRKPKSSERTYVHRVAVGKLQFVREITLCQKGSGYKTARERGKEHTTRWWRTACRRPSWTSHGTSVVHQLPLYWTLFGATHIQFRPSRSLSEDEFQQRISTLANRRKPSFVSWPLPRVSYTQPVPTHIRASKQTE